MSWQNENKHKIMSAEDAVKLVESGNKVYVGTCSSMAYECMRALWKRHDELEGVRLQSSQVLKPCPLFDETVANPFSFDTYFIGVGERKVRGHGLPLNFTSIHLSQVDLWANEVARPDVCIFDVSEPDENGYMSYGPSGIALHTYLKSMAKKIIVQVNKQTPYIYGQDNLIHISEADAIVEVDETSATLGNPEIDEVTKTLSDIIVAQVPDGATIQLGLGTLSTAIGFGLKTKNDLGIYSELMSQPMVDLMIQGNVTNQHKGFLDGKSVFAFSLGTEELYKYLHKNEAIYGAPFPFVNDARNIAKNRKMTSDQYDNGNGSFWSGSIRFPRLEAAKRNWRTA